MENENVLKMEILPLKANIAFVRSAVCAFCTLVLDKLEDINDIKTSISEAFTNCVIHSGSSEFVRIEVTLLDESIKIEISDKGIGIPNIEDAIQPFYTTKESDNRSGMGFTLMQAFMDTMEVKSEEGKGTTVILTKKRTSVEC